MTLVGFSKTRRLQFMLLLVVLAMGPTVLVLSGDSRAGSKNCEYSGANRPACITTNNDFYCSAPVQGLLPGTCSGPGNDCDNTGTWDCGTGIICVLDVWTGQPCGNTSVCE